MGGRWFHIAVLVAWLLSMSWLFVDKVLPPFRAGQRPAYDAYLAESEDAAEPAGWRVEWDNQEIGWAVMRSERVADGTVAVRSMVRFEALPVDRIVTELLGSLGPSVRWAVLGQGDLRLDLAVVTRMSFEADGGLRSFESRVHSGSLRNLMRVAGKVTDGQLQLIVYGHSESAGPGEGQLDRALPSGGGSAGERLRERHVFAAAPSVRFAGGPALDVSPVPPLPARQSRGDH